MSNDFGGLGPIGKIPEELVKDSRVANRVDRERAELFEVMVKTPAWIAYAALLQTLIEKQGTLVLDPAGSVDRAILLEYEKGTMRGLLMALNYPSTIVNGMKQVPDPEES